jgi:sterol O-acyltransferase
MTARRTSFKGAEVRTDTHLSHKNEGKDKTEDNSTVVISETFTKKTETVVDTTSGIKEIQQEEKTTWTYDKRLGPKPRARASVLDRLDQLPVNEGTKNFAILCMIMYACNVMSENYFTKGYLVNWSVFNFIISDVGFALALWQGMIVWCFGMYFLTSLSLRRKIPKPLAAFLFGTALIVLLLTPVFVIVICDMNCVMAGATVAQSIVHAMKMYSYWATNWILDSKKRELKRKQQTDQNVNTNATIATTATTTINTDKCPTNQILEENDPSLLIFPSNVNFANFIYFLSCPSLVYEVSFPLTTRIRWGYFFSLLFQAAATFFVLYLFLVENLIPVFIEAREMPLLRAILKLSLGTMALWMLSFYGIFHCVLGMIAEVTRFADREFYQDWWNAKSFDVWWRRWNRPVYRWMLRHIYNDSIHTVKFPKEAATFATFLVSAILHEWIMTVSFRMFRPFLSTTMLLQIGLIYLTKMKILQGTQFGNLMMWCALFVGQPCIWVLYAREYFTIVAQRNS